MKLVVVFLLGIIGANSVDVLATGTQSGAHVTGGMLTKAKRASASLIRSAEVVCESEFDACSSESGCRTCMEIDESEMCRRDPDVDSFQCDETEETLCCIFTSDATCTNNEELLALTRCLEEKCPFSLACENGFTIEDVGDTPLKTVQGNDVVVAGPDAHVDTDTEAVGLANIDSGTDAGDGVADGSTAAQTTGAATSLASGPSKFAIFCTPALVVTMIFFHGA